MQNTELNFTNGIQTIFTWIVRLAYLNILWILFTLVGLILLGIGPATISVFTVLRRFLKDGDNFSTWKLFQETYFQNFLNANKLMLVILPIAAFIYVDFTFIRMLPSSFIIDKIAFPGIIILSLLAIVFISYSFAVYVHFELPFWRNFKYAIMLSAAFPLSTIMILLGLFIFSIIILILPAASIFYLVSVPAFIIQTASLRGFKRIPTTT